MERNEQYDVSKLDDAPPTRPCKCGCRTMIPIKDKKNRDVFWVKGHNARGKKSTNYRNRDIVELYKLRQDELVDQIIALRRSIDAYTGGDKRIQQRLIELVNREKYWFQACEILIDNKLIDPCWEGYPEELKKEKPNECK